MRNLSIAFESFMDGFPRAGLFGWAKRPGGADTIYEETNNIEESQFADLLAPFLKQAEPTIVEVEEAFRLLRQKRFREVYESPAYSLYPDVRRMARELMPRLKRSSQGPLLLIPDGEGNYRVVDTSDVKNREEFVRMLRELAGDVSERAR